MSDAELERLSSDDLIAQIRAATDAGRSDHAGRALAILCYRHLDDVRRRISLRVPPGDVEDATMTVIVAAIQSAFDGTSIGEFVKWLNRIVDRRGIADYHRRREGQPAIDRLPTEHVGEEEIWGKEPAVEDETGALFVESVAEQCLAALSTAHRDVIEHNVYSDLDATKTAARVNADHPDLDPPMSNDNVHQIVSRYRRCVRAGLADHDPG
ncbi:MAG: hypothetical protein GEU88_16875 [Solirubrobacterales bacterium]|nr:hypothetical protein [Solirubrobacterales bacterium]